MSHHDLPPDLRQLPRTLEEAFGPYERSSQFKFAKPERIFSQHRCNADGYLAADCALALVAILAAIVITFWS